MKLLMLSGDRQVVVGEKGPFHTLQREFSRWFERIDVLVPAPTRPVTTRCLFDVVHFHTLEAARTRRVARIAQLGEELIAEHGAQLVVSHDYGLFANGLAAARIAKRTGVPYLSELHHIPGYPVAESMRERLERRIARSYVAFARERALAFRVVNHQQMPELLLRWGVPREKIAVIPSLYIDRSVFHQVEQAVLQRFDLCFVGRMVENKGLLRLVDAFTALHERGLALSMLLVGRGPLQKTVAARLAKRKLERFVTWKEWVGDPAELAQLYCQSRLVVCASTCEGGPRFTVEALACGTPVISTPVGVMPDLLQDGKAGRLVGFDVASLAEGIAALLADESQRQAAGREGARLAQEFEYARTIRFYAKELHRLAGEPFPERALRG
jgi:glycosyltransferase involved in cell wall biosynthesis